MLPPTSDGCITRQSFVQFAIIQRLVRVPTVCDCDRIARAVAAHDKEITRTPNRMSRYEAFFLCVLLFGPIRRVRVCLR